MILPAVLTCAALGLVLGRHPPGRAILAAGACALAAAAGSFLQVTAQGAPALVVMGWASLAMTAATAFLRASRLMPVVLVLALNAGLWVGAQVGARPALPLVLAALAVALPARALVLRDGVIAVRVVASWLVTIGVLNAAIPVATPTPGYVRDHME